MSPSEFPGEILHSRFYRRPEDYAGQTLLVVGSFASGSDLSRQLASLNLASKHPPSPPSESDPPQLPSEKGYTKVYISSSGPNTHSPAQPDQSWRDHLNQVDLISYISNNVVHFKDGQTVHDIDTIIFATGYNFSLPFCKNADPPWRENRILDGEDQQGGMKGLGVRGLDGLMLFLEGDQSIAFPTLRAYLSLYPVAIKDCRIQKLKPCRVPNRPVPTGRSPNPPNLIPMGSPPPCFPKTPKPTDKLLQPILDAPLNSIPISTGDSGRCSQVQRRGPARIKGSCTKSHGDEAETRFWRAL